MRPEPKAWSPKPEVRCRSLALAQEAAGRRPAVPCGTRSTSATHPVQLGRMSAIGRNSMMKVGSRSGWNPSRRQVTPAASTSSISSAPNQPKGPDHELQHVDRHGHGVRRADAACGQRRHVRRRDEPGKDSHHASVGQSTRKDHHIGRAASRGVLLHCFTPGRASRRPSAWPVPQPPHPCSGRGEQPRVDATG